ncbi:GrpB family protein [Streptomyces sp. NPDC059897]|uniref:GrpB family protein n=1 Tax=Streptomyces sp. NPDC059897 TaxID=3346994 RepID=UPI00364BDF88
MTTNPDSDDALWATIDRLRSWLDDNNGRPPQEALLLRMLKLSEEVGEVSEAVIGAIGQNPRKGLSHSWGDVESELCDVVVTALVALGTVAPDPRGTLHAHVAKVADRSLDAKADTAPDAAPDDAKPVVVPHDTEWAVGGRELCALLRERLGPAALHVDHIGSTSVPGMAAKDIYDVQVSVADLDGAAAAFDAPLAALGFERAPYLRDHVPAGREADEDPADWAKRYWSRRGGNASDVNLHVRRAGSPNERLALLFRDWLRATPDAVPAYARFKRVLAGNVPDTGTYADVKDPVVDLVAVVAEQWAEATGWRPHP